MSQLKDFEKYNMRNWDGYDGDPITAKTLKIARFIEKCVGERPDIAPAGDGSICFEWVLGPDKLFLDVYANGLSIYGMLDGETFHTIRERIKPTTIVTEQEGKIEK
jgi:hypothetical protein